MTPKKFLAIKFLVFCLISYFCISFIYSFPDVPSILRPIIRKGAIRLPHEDKAKPDTRFFKWFDRDPERTIPAAPGLIVSPADGVVQGVVVVQESQHIVIEMRYTDVHVQRVPLDGVIIALEGEGKKLPEGASVRQYISNKMLPYQKRTVLETEIGQIAIRQITSLFASRIEVFVKVGEKVVRGQRLGRVIAGSTVVLEIPLNLRVLVKTNEEVTGGETILARY